LEIYDAEYSNIHGGTIIAYVCHKGLRKKTKKFLNLLKLERLKKVNKLEFYLDLANKINKLKLKFKRKLDFLKKRNVNIYGIGAPAKSTTLINYFGINNKDIKFTTENNHLKIGKYLPYSHIKIIDEKFIKKISFNKDIFLIFSWNFKKNIIKKYKKKFGNSFRYFLPY
jgi:hypothetical protein